MNDQRPWLWRILNPWTCIVLFAIIFGIGYYLPAYERIARSAYIGLVGLVLLLGGLIPVLPGYTHMQADDPTPTVSYVLRVVLGVSVLIGAFGIYFGWQARQSVVIGFVISGAILSVYMLRWLWRYRR